MCYICWCYCCVSKGGYSSDCWGPVLSSSLLCPFLTPLLGSAPSQLHLKQPVDPHWTWGCSKTPCMFQNSSSHTCLALRNNHPKHFLIILTPRSSPVDLGQSSGICMLLNKWTPKGESHYRTKSRTVCSWKVGREGVQCCDGIDLQRRKITAKREPKSYSGTYTC